VSGETGRPTATFLKVFSPWNKLGKKTGEAEVFFQPFPTAAPKGTHTKEAA
jgi:hypothetical protein